MHIDTGWWFFIVAHLAGLLLVYGLLRWHLEVVMNKKLDEPLHKAIHESSDAKHHQLHDQVRRVVHKRIIEHRHGSITSRTVLDPGIH